jgi:predicted PurR-regulated permease PerM
VSTQPYLLRVVLAAITIIGILVSAWFIWQIRSILLLLGVGILFAAIIEPLVNRLRRIGLSRGQSLLILYVAFFAILGSALYYILPLLAKQIAAFDDAIPALFDNLRQQALQSGSALVRQSGFRALMQIENAWNNIRNNPSFDPNQAFSIVNSVFAFGLTAISVLIVTFYWTVEKLSVKRWVLGLFPFTHRVRAHTVWDEIEYKIGGWARGQLLLMLIIGVIFGVVFWAIDLRFWLALAILSGLTEAIPYIGPIFAGAVAALVALTESPEKAIMVVVIAFVIQQLEGAFLVPRIMKSSVGLTPLTVVLAVLIGNALGGPAGSIIAIPIGAAAQVIVGSLLRSRDDSIADELRTLDIQPLSPGHFDTPFAPPSKPIFSLRGAPAGAPGDAKAEP